MGKDHNCVVMYVFGHCHVCDDHVSDHVHKFMYAIDRILGVWYLL